MKKLIFLLCLFFIPVYCFAGAGGIGLLANVSAGGGGTDTVAFLASSSTSAVSATTITLTTPTGTANGDLMLVGRMVDNPSSTLQTPSGFTVVNTATGDGNFNAVVYGIIFTGTPASTYDFTNLDAGSINHTIAGMTFRKSGGTWTAISSLVNATTGTANSSTTSAITASTGDAYTPFFFNDGASTVTTPPSNMDESEVVTGTSTAIAGYVKESVSSGSQSSTITWSGTEQLGSIQVNVGLQ